MVGSDFKYENLRKFRRRLLYHKYNGRCAYCGCRMTYDEMTVDHIIPQMKGGKSNPKNYRACCGPCNMFKGSKTMKEFRIAIVEKPNDVIAEKYENWDGIFYYERI